MTRASIPCNVSRQKKMRSSITLRISNRMSTKNCDDSMKVSEKSVCTVRDVTEWFLKRRRWKKIHPKPKHADKTAT